MALTDGDEVLALLISVADWEDVRDALDVAFNEIDRLRGVDDGVEHDEFVGQLRGEGHGA
ncbi:hypothetical protein [Streptomyces sp. 8K308]|uniref:hypothetical protein n=1 Tax=Streptomyces sp. 8K308 TaxID=2530388 RepID=UPI00140527D4|nr:hypothetical protein [Streptomyces sp. 8K308]